MIHARTARSGLTMLEVLVAVALLAIVMLGVMATQSSAALQREAAREELVARQLLNTFIEDMRQQDIANIYAEIPLGPTNFTPSSGDMNDLKDASIVFLRVPSEDGSVGLTDGVNVTVSVPLADRQALGFADAAGNTVGLDLNLEDTDSNGDFADDGTILPTNLGLLPAKATITWTSVLGVQRTFDVYVVFSDH